MPIGSRIEVITARYEAKLLLGGVETEIEIRTPSLRQRKRVFYRPRAFPRAIAFSPQASLDRYLKLKPDLEQSLGPWAARRSFDTAALIKFGNR